MSTNHDKFLEALDDSRRAVFAVAEWVTRQGLDVLIPGETRADKFEDREAHSDKGDMFIKSKDKYLRAEVRHHREGKWTGVDDWPSRNVYGAIVGPVRNYSENIYAWFHVNADMTHFYQVRQDSKVSWSTHAVPDGQTGLPKDNYFAPLIHVSFRSIGGK